jgi:hypothetical protein
VHPGSGGGGGGGPCARSNCPCTSTWNGQPGEHCCRKCAQGTPCAGNYHPGQGGGGRGGGGRGGGGRGGGKGGGGGGFQEVDRAKFGELKGQFDAKWLHQGKSHPTIAKIYNVHDARLLQEHEQYCTSIDPNGSIPVYGRGKSPGNQQRRFHGTGMMCTFSGRPCGDKDCHACSIMASGFKTRRAPSPSPPLSLSAPYLFLSRQLCRRARGHQVRQRHVLVGDVVQVVRLPDLAARRRVARDVRGRRRGGQGGEVW